MNYCLVCHEPIQLVVGWRAIFSAAKELFFCSSCEKKLETIEGEICRICFRPFRYLAEEFRYGDICHDCLRWEEDPNWQGCLEQNRSLFVYNDFLKEVIARYKFRGDYVLAKAFTTYLKEEFQKSEADLYVPIPLSEERLYERGFNQAEALIVESAHTPSAVLTRIHSEKQSKKSRAERIFLSQVFQLHPDIDLLQKRVLLVDDIYTTGSTLRHAAKLLKGAGAESIRSLTIAR